MAQPLPSAARDFGDVAQSTSPEAGWAFLAPSHGDLVACPYCVNRLTHCCDYCGDEGVLFAMDIPENLHG